MKKELLEAAGITFEQIDSKYQKRITMREKDIERINKGIKMTNFNPKLDELKKGKKVAEAEQEILTLEEEIKDICMTAIAEYELAQDDNAEPIKTPEQIEAEKIAAEQAAADEAKKLADAEAEKKPRRRGLFGFS